MAAPIPKLPAAFAIGIGLIGCYFLAWLAASFGLLGEAHIGYDGDFYFVKHALQKAGCVDSMEYSRHEDLTLEDFHFKVRTKSGRFVRVFFVEGQDVGLVCRAPRGLLVIHPRDARALNQVYDIEAILERLNGIGVKVADLQALLCNIDELATLFDANYDSDAIPKFDWEHENSRRFSDYLRLEVLDESIDHRWIETPIARANVDEKRSLNSARRSEWCDLEATRECHAVQCKNPTSEGLANHRVARPWEASSNDRF